MTITYVSPGTIMEKKKKSRLEKPKKQYAKDQCALYGLKGLGQLRKVLEWHASQRRLERVPEKKSSYKVWRNSKGRDVQEAIGELRALHVRIATLLRRISPPDYRHSGVRGRSYITNASEHAVGQPSIKIDIKAFYPSTTFHHVYAMFRGYLECADDVALLLAKICCFRETHLPTGGVHSEVTAFFSHKALFDRIANRAVQFGGRFTVYVDDLVMTFDKASASDLSWAANEIKKHGLILHPDKSRVIGRRERKTITGVTIAGEVTLAPQKNHLNVLSSFRSLSELRGIKDAGAARRLIGQLDQIAQIDPRFKSRAKGNRIRLKNQLE